MKFTEKSDLVQILNFNFPTGTVSENISEDTFTETLKYDTIYAFRIDLPSKKWVDLFFYKVGELVCGVFFTSHPLSDGSSGGSTGFYGNLYSAVMRFAFDQEIHNLKREKNIVYD